MASSRCAASTCDGCDASRPPSSQRCLYARRLFFSLPAGARRLRAFLIASVLLAPNVYFWSITRSYFEPAADILPLLHYWSLGVEEQFYLVFPVICLVALKAGRRWLDATLLVLALVSLVASSLTVRHDPGTAFYLFPFRAYEVLIGCLLALPGIPCPTRPKVAAGATGCGLAMLAAAVALYDNEMPYPGLAALLPTAGAALVLWGSDRAVNVVSRMLGSAAAAFIGRISYSLYLVHWPLIVFALRVFPYTRHFTRSMCVLALALALAYLSYELVEQPFRRAQTLWSPKRLVWVSGGSLAALVAVASLLILGSGFPGPLDAKANEILAFRVRDYRTSYRTRTCFLAPTQAVDEINLAECLPQGTGKKAILWGDSTAAHIYFGLRAPLSAAGYSLGQLTSSACPPIKDLDAAGCPNCRPFNDLALEWILREKPDLVILVASDWPLSPANTPKIQNTLDKLIAGGVKPIMLGMFPQYRAAVPKILADRIRRGDHNQLSGRDLDPATMTRERALREQFATRPGVKFVSALDAACPAQQCPLLVGDAPVEFDDHHLTEAGSVYFAQRLLPRSCARWRNGKAGADAPAPRLDFGAGRWLRQLSTRQRTSECGSQVTQWASSRPAPTWPGRSRVDSRVPGQRSQTTKGIGGIECLPIGPRRLRC